MSIHEQDHRILRALLVMFVFMVIVFTLLAYRNEANTRAIRDQADLSCAIRNVNVTRMNRLYQGIVEIERKNPYRKVSPETVHRRIALYTSAMSNLVPCRRY